MNNTLSAELYKRSCLDNGLSFSKKIYFAAQTGVMKRRKINIDALFVQYNVPAIPHLIMRLKRLNYVK